MFSMRNWPVFGYTFAGMSEKFENLATLILRGPALMLIDQWSHISSERLLPQTWNITDILCAVIFNFRKLSPLFVFFRCGRCKSCLHRLCGSSLYKCLLRSQCSFKG